MYFTTYNRDQDIESAIVTYNKMNGMYFTTYDRDQDTEGAIVTFNKINQMYFTTYDRDQDRWPDGNCAENY